MSIVQDLKVMAHRKGTVLEFSKLPADFQWEYVKDPATQSVRLVRKVIVTGEAEPLCVLIRK